MPTTHHPIPFLGTNLSIMDFRFPFLQPAFFPFIFFSTYTMGGGFGLECVLLVRAMLLKSVVVGMCMFGTVREVVQRVFTLQNWLAPPPIKRPFPACTLPPSLTAWLHGKVRLGCIDMGHVCGLLMASLPPQEALFYSEQSFARTLRVMCEMGFCGAGEVPLLCTFDGGRVDETVLEGGPTSALKTTIRHRGMTHQDTVEKLAKAKEICDLFNKAAAAEGMADLFYGVVVQGWDAEAFSQDFAQWWTEGGGLSCLLTRDADNMMGAFRRALRATPRTGA